MKKRIKIFTFCAALFLAGVGLGCILMIPGPASGGGQYKESPDGKWVASADTLDDGPVVGPHRTYYEFKIQTPSPSSRIVRKMIIEDTVKPPIWWRDEGSILWTTNNSSVTFKSDIRETSVEITLRFKP